LLWPTRFYSRKGFYALNVQAIVDSKGRFLWFAAIGPGSMNDHRAYMYTGLYELLSERLDGKTSPSGKQFWLAGDEAYHTKHIITPYGGRNLTPQQDAFNFWLSNSRTRVEMAFGILVHRFPVFWSAIRLRKLGDITMLIGVCMRIHNMQTEGGVYHQGTDAQAVNATAVGGARDRLPRGPIVCYTNETAWNGQEHSDTPAAMAAAEEGGGAGAARSTASRRRWLPQQVLRRKLTESVWGQGKRRPLTGPAVGPRRHGCEVGFNDEVGQQHRGERFGGVPYAPSNATALGLMRE
jgi:hypothetical protein